MAPPRGPKDHGRGRNFWGLDMRAPPCIPCWEEERGETRVGVIWWRRAGSL